MEVILFIISILFWTLFYIFEGSHDAAFVKETKFLKDNIVKQSLSKMDNEIIEFELEWHLYDALEKTLTKIVFTILIYLITNNWLFSFQMLLLSVGIRSVMHDLIVAIKLRKGFNHIGPDFLWWDRFLRRMQNRGINQYFIKLFPNLILIAWILISL